MVDSSEPLLAGSVPDLHLDLPSVDVEHLHLEVHSDGGYVVLVEVILAESQENVGLPNSRLPDDDQLNGVRESGLLNHTV